MPTRLTNAERTALTSRAATLIACGWSLTDTATHLNVSPTYLQRLLSTQRAQTLIQQLSRRPYDTISNASIQSIITGREALAQAIPKAVNTLLAAIAEEPGHYETRIERDGSLAEVWVPNPKALPPAVRIQAIKELLDRGGLTPRTTEVALGVIEASAPTQSTQPVTPDLVDALTRLVEAAHTLPIPSHTPPLLREGRIIDAEEDNDAQHNTDTQTTDAQVSSGGAE